MALLDIKHKSTIETIKQKLILDNAKLDQDKINNPKLSSTYEDQKQSNTLEANAQIEKAEKELAAAKVKIEQDNVKNKKESSDQIIAIVKNQTDEEIKEAERSRDKRLCNNDC